MVERRCTTSSRSLSSFCSYLKNDGQLEVVQHMAGHASPRTTELHDRRDQETTLDEVERIIL